jgi:hypothetical protein
MAMANENSLAAVEIRATEYSDDSRRPYSSVLECGLEGLPRSSHPPC